MKKKLHILLALLLALALLAGCGGAEKGADSSASMTGSADMAAPQEANGFYGGGAETAPAAPELQKAPSLPENAKLIYTADIDLETTEFDRAVEQLESLVASAGGYFESSSLSNYSSYRYGSYVVRVPAERFSAFCDQIGSLCQVNGIHRNAEDISEAYYDTESRLVTQQTKLARLQDLLSRAENMEDIITIESAISETELQIESLTGTLRRYDSLAGYSTITISLSEVARLSELEEPAIGFGAQLGAALRSGARDAVDGVQSFVLWLARNWAGILIVLLIAAAVVAVILTTRRRRRRKEQAYLRARQEKPDEPEQTE